MKGLEENHPVDEFEDWTSFINRGGLTQVGNMTYGVFLSMEPAISNFSAKILLSWETSRQNFRN